MKSIRSHCFCGLRRYIIGMEKTAQLDKWTAMRRGLKGDCPKCDDAKLFQSYLKPVNHCPSCGENWEDVRADDGPAWASMLIAGHVLAPFFYFITFRTELPDWIRTLALVIVGVVMCLVALPRMKGLFMAWIWYTDAPTSTRE